MVARGDQQPIGPLALKTYVNHGDLQRPSEFDWLMLPTWVNDIIGTDFDWLMIPTTTD